MSKSLHKFEGHTDEVLKVEWEPNNLPIFASCSKDRKIRVWDISKIGQQVKAENPIEGAPELMVINSLNSLLTLNSFYIVDIELV